MHSTWISPKATDIFQEQSSPHSPLKNLLRLLFRDLDTQVPQGLHDLLSIDSSCDKRAVSRVRHLVSQRHFQQRSYKPNSPSFFLSRLLNTSLSFFS